MMTKKQGNGRPFTDLEDLVHAATDQAVDERVMPVIKEMRSATEDLRAAAGAFDHIHRRQNGQEIWLIVLSAVAVMDIIFHIVG